MKITVIGHSHMQCLKMAYKKDSFGPDVDIKFVQLRNDVYLIDKSAGFLFNNINVGRLEEFLAASVEPSSKVAICVCGNEHSVVSMIKNPELNQKDIPAQIESRLDNFEKWMDILSGYIPSDSVVIPPPPPIESEEHIRQNPGIFAERIRKNGINSSEIRLNAWRHQIKLMKNKSNEFRYGFFDHTEFSCNKSGFIKATYVGNDPTHANIAYGREVLNMLIKQLRANPSSQSVTRDFQPISRVGAKRKHPYLGLPDRAFWKQSISAIPSEEVDPTCDPCFIVNQTDRVATAGSCFAQHISKRIRDAGFHFLVTETTAQKEVGDTPGQNFDFSARYGNIYTARQLKQLFDRCYGRFSPVDSAWKRRDGKYCDPFRPQIEGSGFSTVESLEEDRKNHLQAVREMFEKLDIFVFTLGLTECWLSKVDGAAFPIAPGVAGGEFDEKKYRFENFSVYEVVSDLQSFLDGLRRVNPAARLILTVSPVPLVATYEEQHILVSTTYSKSVLRVAAEMIRRQNEGVVYFPSYEVITGNFNRGAYFGPDLRAVTESGVDHVMRLFMNRMTAKPTSTIGTTPMPDENEMEMARLAEAACDEELLEKEPTEGT